MNRKTSLFEKPRTSAEMEAEKSGKYKIGKSVEGSESSGDISMRCRLCGMENEDMIDIFRIQKMIDYCLHIVVEKADTLPKRVWQICFVKLELFYQFNQIANKVDELFRASAEQGTGELEQPIIKNNETEGQTPDETGLSSPVLTRSKNFAAAMVSSPGTSSAQQSIPESTSNSEVSEYAANPGRSSAQRSIPESTSNSEVSEYGANPETSSAQQSIPESTSDSEVSDITAGKFKAASRKLSSRQREQKSEDVRIEQENSAVPERPCGRKARFKCNVCSKTYATKDRLNGHKKLHSDKGLFTCSRCEDKFNFESEGRRHYQFHTNPSLKHAEPRRSDSCKYCHKTFRNQQDRDFHYYRFHKIEFPFKCAVCGKKFTTRYSLRRHVVVHSNERNHHCDTCEKGFKTPQGRNLHMKTTHASD